MQLAKIGLSRLGANMVRRLLKGGHQCLLFDMSPKAVGIPAAATSSRRNPHGSVNAACAD
jgi:6-phosphogluconate dehydrogenase (decarboxylating)